jgi:hypothetical protein
MQDRPVGRPSLGPRKRTTVRIYEDLMQRAEAHVAACGLTFNDLVNALVARHLSAETGDTHAQPLELPLAV